MTIEEDTAAKNAQLLEVTDKICGVLDQLEPPRRLRVLLAVTLISCPQALTTEQVVEAFNNARLG
jgi:hypothetical protein